MEQIQSILPLMFASSHPHAMTESVSLAATLRKLLHSLLQPSDLKLMLKQHHEEKADPCYDTAKVRGIVGLRLPKLMHSHLEAIKVAGRGRQSTTVSSHTENKKHSCFACRLSSLSDTGQESVGIYPSGNAGPDVPCPQGSGSHRWPFTHTSAAVVDRNSIDARWRE